MALAANIINPVGCKVSATTMPEELKSIAATVDPDREPGCLMLIARMGSATDRLPVLMEAVKAAHRTIWLTDPMHANTLTAPDSWKVRYLINIATELIQFQQAVSATGVTVSGVHLETTIDDVRECLADSQDPRHGDKLFTSLCDPRLTINQALEVLSHWQIGASS